MNRLNKVLLITGLGFLIYLVCRIRPADLLQQASALGWGIIPLIAIEGIANLAHTVGWRYCIRGSASRVPLLRLYRMATTGYAINYLTPSASLGGEVSRAGLLATYQKGADAVSSVLLDKLMTALAHLALAVLGSLFLLWKVSLPTPLWIAMAAATVLLTAGMTAFLVLQKNGKLGAIFRWFAARKLGGRFLEAAAQRVSEVDESLKQYSRERPWGLVLSVGYHLAGHAMAILQAWVFLRLLHQPAPLVTVAAAGLLSLWFDLMTFAVPLNLGTLEGSRVVVFSALGCPALLGMGYGLALRVAQLFWACYGLVCYILFPAQTNGMPEPESKGSSISGEATRLPPPRTEP
jgi:uncharacterized protein (TIRG00374 family)